MQRDTQLRQQIQERESEHLIALLLAPEPKRAHHVGRVGDERPPAFAPPWYQGHPFGHQYEVVAGARVCGFQGVFGQGEKPLVLHVDVCGGRVLGQSEDEMRKGDSWDVGLDFCFRMSVFFRRGLRA